jgi:hypothetical protein
MYFDQSSMWTKSLRNYAKKSKPFQVIKMSKTSPKEKIIDLGPVKTESLDEFLDRYDSLTKEEQNDIVRAEQEEQRNQPKVKDTFGYDAMANYRSKKLDVTEEAPEEIKRLTLMMTPVKFEQYIKEKKPMNGYIYDSHAVIGENVAVRFVSKKITKADTFDDDLLKLLAKNIPKEQLYTMMTPEVVKKMESFGDIGNQYKAKIKRSEYDSIEKADQKDREAATQRQQDQLAHDSKHVEEPEDDVVERSRMDEEDDMDENDETSSDHLTNDEKNMLKQEYETIDYNNRLLEFSKILKGNPRVPFDLEERIQNLIKQFPKKEIIEYTKQLSIKFRTRTGGFGNKFEFTPQKKNLYQEHADFIKGGKHNTIKSPSILYGSKESIAYVVHRLPSIYGVLYKIMAEIRKRKPNWNPKEMLDFGTGPGTSIYTSKIFFPSIDSIMAVEPSSDMMNTAIQLMNETTNKQITWRRFLNENMDRQFDLVVASYVLNELVTAADRSRIVRSLFKMTNGILILVEPGTPMGFDLIREARSIVLESRDATIISPCPHDAPCPMSEKSWCHFSVRSDRLPFQKNFNKDMTQGFGDEKYSYVVIEKKGAIKESKDEIVKRSKSFSRILYTPRMNGGHTIMDLCTKDGAFKERVTVTRKEGTPYKFSRALYWGDLYPF